MTIPRNTYDLEYAKFVESDSVPDMPAVSVVNPDGSNIMSGSTPLPSGKVDVDSKFSLSVATGAQTNQTVDSSTTNRAVKEIYVAANGFGEGAYVKFYRGATVVGELYLIAKNFLIRDSLTYSTDTLTCDINTGNSGTITVYFNVKYYQ